MHPASKMSHYCLLPHFSAISIYFLPLKVSVMTLTPLNGDLRQDDYMTGERLHASPHVNPMMRNEEGHFSAPPSQLRVRVFNILSSKRARRERFDLLLEPVPLSALCGFHCQR